eukprot:Amastigsp_a676669_8.p8 type:complete len:101 gc:universal Amastigsp_a676669_8:1026-724(-)
MRKAEDALEAERADILTARAVDEEREHGHGRHGHGNAPVAGKVRRCDNDQAKVLVKKEARENGAGRVRVQHAPVLDCLHGRLGVASADVNKLAARPGPGL